MNRSLPMKKKNATIATFVIFLNTNHYHHHFHCSYNHHFRAYDGQSDMKHNGFSYHGLLRVFALFYMVWKSTKRKLGKNLGFSTSTSFGFKSIWKRGIGRVSLHQMVGAVRRFFARTVPPRMDNTQIWFCKSILQICVDNQRLSQMTIFVKQQLWLA